MQSRFNYAWGLIKSADTNDQRLGVKVLTDVFKDSPQRRRECLYYLSIGTYKLGDYADSRRYVETLLATEPDNQQALALKQMISDKIAKGEFFLTTHRHMDMATNNTIQMDL